MAVRVDSGTVGGARLDFDRFSVSRVVFPPASRLARHSHPRACTAVVVDGGVRKRFAKREADARAGTLVTMHADQPHEDIFGADGATIVVVEEREQRAAAICRLDWEAARIATRIERELREPDGFTPLAVEGLALELVAVAARQQARRVPPRWLEAARDRLHDDPCAPASVDRLAREASVHPAHFSRAFRDFYGDSIGGYARRLRLEWAARALADGDKPLAALAAEAGFADQSHFTRAFKSQFGITPARYRATMR